MGGEEGGGGGRTRRGVKEGGGEGRGKVRIARRESCRLRSGRGLGGGVGEGWLLMRGARQGLPVWPVSLVTRRLGKVITCLGGRGEGRMGLGRMGLILAPGLQ